MCLVYRYRHILTRVFLKEMMRIAALFAIVASAMSAPTPAIEVDHMIASA
eukprot:COSAG05_NODE_1449_length_4858_cov_10.781046_4_plen_50_part_00